MTDTESLLDAIEAMPDDDALRGAYADELEKDGYSPRAELIRVQCELTGYPDVWGSDATKLEQLERRESELLTQHAAEFRRGPKCKACEGTGWCEDGQFRDMVTTCKRCDGTGDAGGLMQQIPYMDLVSRTCPWKHKVEFHRGFPRVHCRMEECVDDDGREYRRAGTIEYRPTDWLLSVVRHHRGVEVWVTDREPQDYNMSDGTGKTPHVYAWYCRFRIGRVGEGFNLPVGIWDTLDKSKCIVRGNWADFDTKELAQVALARAIPAWARKYLNKEKL